jgi:hypothetical protein
MGNVLVHEYVLLLFVCTIILAPKTQYVNRGFRRSAEGYIAFKGSPGITIAGVAEAQRPPVRHTAGNGVLSQLRMWPAQAPLMGSLSNLLPVQRQVLGLWHRHTVAGRLALRDGQARK